MVELQQHEGFNDGSMVHNQGRIRYIIKQFNKMGTKDCIAVASTSTIRNNGPLDLYGALVTDTHSLH